VKNSPLALHCENSKKWV